MRVSLKLWTSIILLSGLLLSGCSPSEKDDKIHVTLLQINDVYEIEPVSGGKLGGLARVATLRKELIEENPNTFTFIAGDFLSPSALGTAKVDGKALDGKQMVAVLNAIGMDYATLGNHEFDLKEAAFLERMSEAHFEWISCNVFGTDGQRFEGVRSTKVIQVPGHGGTQFRMGLVGATINENNPSYVVFKDPLTSLQKAVDELKDESDAIVAITHLDFWDDMAIAKSIPELNLIIGGHDHENMFFRRGENFTPIAKADANAKTAFVHRLTYDPETEEVKIESTLVQIN